MKNLITVLLFSLLYIINSSVCAQSVSDMLNEKKAISIPSPNVASLNKFVEFPVTHFNGQVNISFPIYEIKLKNVTVPITLKYHTGGIRVNEDPGWVGLGWTLDAGGVISHQRNGIDDLTYSNWNNYYGNYFPYLDKSQNETYREGMGAIALSGAKIPNKNGQMEDIIDKFSYIPDQINGDPDTYIYNMGDYSGKFINWSDTIADLGCNNVIFKQYVKNVSSGDSIIATSPEGVLYKFKDIETSFSLTGTSSPEYNNGRLNTSAYYLSEILSPNGERIKFYYKTFQQLMNENHWESDFPDYSYGRNPSYMQAGYYPLIPALFEECSVTMVSATDVRTIEVNSTRLRAYTFVNTLYLEKIEFPSGEIQFIKSPRLDAYGLELDQIRIKNNSGYNVKTVDFQYTYFEGQKQSAGQDVMTATEISTSADINYPENYLKKRLKLVSFSEQHNAESNTHSFTYHEDVKLPYKTSFAQDFWGYYNGQLNTSLLPTYKLYSSALDMHTGFGTGPLSYKVTANRNVNATTVKAGTLKEIIYPTSGKTNFDFEPNECINSFISSSEITPKRISATDIGVGYARETFTLSSKTKVDIEVNLLKHNIQINPGVVTPHLGESYEDSGNLYAQLERFSTTKNKWELFDLKYFWDINSYNSGNRGFTGEELAAGQYRITANFPDSQAAYGSLGSNMASISVSYDVITTTTSNLIGGLRIKQTTHTDALTTDSMITKYTYKKGILATFPRHIYNTVCQHPSFGLPDMPEFAYKASLTTNPVYPYSFAANGSLVGYRNITETYSNGEIGKIEYEYQMEADMIGGAQMARWPQGMPPVSRLSNGSLVSKQIYNKENTTLNKTTFKYSFLNFKVYWGFKVDQWVAYRPTGVCIPNCHDVMASRMQVYFYPIIQGKTAVNSEQEEDYRQGVIPPIQKTINYEYNDYCQLISKKTKDSSSKDVTETYKYVPEKAQEAGGVYTQMKSKNVISPLIETLTDHNGSTIKQVTNYSQPYTGVFTPSSIQIQTNSNAIETRIAYNEYDKRSNPLAISKDDAEKVVYLWGYNYQYPIAKIENVTYSEVETAAKSVFSVASMDALSTLSTPDETKLKDGSLQKALPKAMVTTYTYKPLVGIQTVTDPSIVTTTYEYDSFGRLQAIKDENNKVVENYEYHYKN